MTYEEFFDFVFANCMYETIYDDSDGRPILVIRMLDAYSMVNKVQRTWVGLTNEDYSDIFKRAQTNEHAVQLAKAKSKEKNSE